MKLFHLADLHIGIGVNGFSMLRDQQYILDQVLEYMRTERPGALLIAGDVYDRQTPSAEAVRLFDRFLTEAAEMEIPILMISGNHDSPERLSFAGGIMEKQGVYIHGIFDGGLRIVRLRDEQGELCVHLMPYLRPSAVRRFFPDREIVSWQQAVEAALERHPLDTAVRNVLVAHQFVVALGGEPERSESEIGPVGGLDAVDARLFDRFDYVALGHLHRPQNTVAGRIRYAGSPLKYSFSECLHPKSITVVELERKGGVDIIALPLRPLRDMRHIAGPIGALLSEEVASQGNREDYLHVTLTDEEEIHDAIGRVRYVYPNVMAITFDNRRSRAMADPDGVDEAEDKAPAALFADFYREQNGEEMSEEQAALVQAMLEGER